jgi:peptidoglycan/LPS O-acetylase OafA/YrhL
MNQDSTNRTQFQKNLKSMENTGGTGARSSARIAGLDSIRFVCAFVVVVAHFGLVPREIFGSDPHGAALLARAALGSLFDGPAAVIVFFVISGFCIHFPYRHNPSVNLLSYYSRRLIRIGAPALIALSIWNWVGVKNQSDENGIFWSVICEVEYYLLYPFLLRLRLQFGWLALIVVSQVAAYSLALTHLDSIERGFGGYPAFGWWNWVIGLPCWLIGCWLAESFESFSQISPAWLWLIRIGVFSSSAGLQALRFHGGSVFLSNAFTLNLFAVIAGLWLGLEIAYRRRKSAPRILEWAGKWSYSLYLMHPAVPGLVAMQEWLRPIFLFGGGTVPFIVSSLPAAYLFYLVVEAPFHRIAIAVSKRLKAPLPAAPLAAQDS